MTLSRLSRWTRVLLVSLALAACQGTETVTMHGTLQISSEYREFVSSKGKVYKVKDSAAMKSYVHDGSPYPNEWRTEVEVQFESSDMVSRGAGSHGSIKITRVIKATKKR